MNQNNKRRQICSAAFIQLDSATIMTEWGKDMEGIEVEGAWIELPVRDAEYSEETTGDGIYSQKFYARMTDTSETQMNMYRDLFAKRGLLRIDYTDGQSKVVGDEEWPVMIALNLEGIPEQCYLSMKRDSCSHARCLSSF